jgi:AraC-like DNA-binding protein
MTSQPVMMRGNDAPPLHAIDTDRLISTAGVAPSKKLDFWRDVVCHTIAGVEATALTDDRPYEGLIRSRSIPLTHMPSFDLLKVEADPQRVNRTRELIKFQMEETWLLMIQDEGNCHIRQGDREATLAPGDIGFLDTSRPYEVIFPRTFKQSILKMPALLFQDVFPKSRDLSGKSLSGNEALTTIARQNLVLLDRLAATINSRMLPAAACRAIDHLALAVRALFDTRTQPTARHLSAAHFENACSFISENLSDPSLSVEPIAQAAGLSSGHLQEIFRKKTGNTVASYVRDQRLAHCRRDLADPSLAGESITSISFRWGFSESSSFSRAFRAAFKTSPRSYRRTCRVA